MTQALLTLYFPSCDLHLTFTVYPREKLETCNDMELYCSSNLTADQTLSDRPWSKNIPSEIIPLSFIRKTRVSSGHYLYILIGHWYKGNFYLSTTVCSNHVECSLLSRSIVIEIRGWHYVILQWPGIDFL